MFGYSFLALGFFGLIVPLLINLVPLVDCLDNGLARTPPMGWMTWAKFSCIVNCTAQPDDCISDKLIRSMASVMVSEGYLDAGYNYINIDDCWSEMERDSITSALLPDHERFPYGMRNLSNFVHSIGLRFGMYGDIGTKTCQGYPGFWIGNGSASDYFLLDSETFASWGVDSLKVDGCYQDIDIFDKIYPRLGEMLNFTGKINNLNFFINLISLPLFFYHVIYLSHSHLISSYHLSLC